ncbi:MAG: radical SAM protein [Candidatus Omnitrophota bacterium]
MNIALINPNLVVQKKDPLTTGIVYMPVMLAYAAAALENSGHQVTVIDAYALKPRQVRHLEQFWIFGLTEKEILERLPKQCGLVVIYANQLINHLSLIRIIQAIKKFSGALPIAILENSQAVTAYSVDHEAVASRLYQAGADYLIPGDGEETLVVLAAALEKGLNKNVSGLAHPGHIPVRRTRENIDELPFPAWHLFPLEQYWNLGFAHGPLTGKKYLPMLTSRGCPYSCRFCVSPTTAGKWRGRSACNVVDEMQTMSERFGVTEFHWEDINPTVSDERIRQICAEIQNRALKVTWKLVSGTKAETIKNEETIELMAAAGCRYISISPEAGSEDVLRSMHKPFDLNHAKKIIDSMNQNRIPCQACFVLGFPTETPEDLIKTKNLVKELTCCGIDEIALFIMTPVPGSSVFDDFDGYSSFSELNFTPIWRKDYRTLNGFRSGLYRKFLCWKLLSHPAKIIAQPFSFLSRKFNTKMEMVPYRALKLWWWAKKSNKQIEIQATK